MPQVPRRWYREPMLWLVLAIPLATVIAGVWMLRVAGGAGSVDASTDRVRRTAQVQVADLGADEAAARLGLSARLQATGEGLSLDLVGAVVAAPLTLDLQHPVDSTRDRRLLLLPRDGRWHSADRLDASHAWNLRLGPTGGAWRLTGRWQPGDTAVDLESALSTP